MALAPQLLQILALTAAALMPSAHAIALAPDGSAGGGIAPAIAGVCYGTQGGNGVSTLLTIDIQTGAGTAVGPTGVLGLPGLAIAPDGSMFATSRGSSSGLYRLDAATAEATLVGNTAVNFVGAIAFDANGDLWGLGAPSGPTATLYRIDPVTAVATAIGPTGEILTGMAFDPTDGSLYASSGGGSSAVVPDAIYTLNTTTAAITLVGTTGLGGSTPDLHFDLAGNLYGSKVAGGTGGGAGASTLIGIDKSNGAGVAIGPIGFDAVSGLASQAFGIVGVAPPRVPAAAVLHHARPNPFSVSTRVDFALHRSGHVNIEVFNLAGQRVTRLLDRPMPAGEHTVQWSGQDAGGRKVANGLYYVRLRIEGFHATRKLVRVD